MTKPGSFFRLSALILSVLVILFAGSLKNASAEEIAAFSHVKVQKAEDFLKQRPEVLKRLEEGVLFSLGQPKDRKSVV